MALLTLEFSLLWEQRFELLQSSTKLTEAIYPMSLNKVNLLNDSVILMYKLCISRIGERVYIASDDGDDEAPIV